MTPPQPFTTVEKVRTVRKLCSDSTSYFSVLPHDVVQKIKQEVGRDELQLRLKCVHESWRAARAAAKAEWGEGCVASCALTQGSTRTYWTETEKPFFQHPANAHYAEAFDNLKDLEWKRLWLKHNLGPKYWGV